MIKSVGRSKSGRFPLGRGVWHKNGVMARPTSPQGASAARPTKARRARAALCRALRDDTREASRLSPPQASRARMGRARASPISRPIAERFAELGYIDDAAFALSKARSLAGRGYGKRRLVEQAAGRRRRRGGRRLMRAHMRTRRRCHRRCASPSAAGWARLRPLRCVSRKDKEKALAAMVRAGHGFGCPGRDRPAAGRPN